MKSAYELAMERFGGGNESKPLSDAQKQELDNISKKYLAKIAEKEVFLQGQIDESRSQGDQQAVSDLELQLRNERLRLQEEMELAKDHVRKGT